MKLTYKCKSWLIFQIIHNWFIFFTFQICQAQFGKRTSRSFTADNKVKEDDYIKTAGNLIFTKKNIGSWLIFLNCIKTVPKWSVSVKKIKMVKKSQACHSHCDTIRIFVQIFKFSITLFLAGKFKFTVGVDWKSKFNFWTKIEILHQCAIVWKSPK